MSNAVSIIIAALILGVAAVTSVTYTGPGRYVSVAPAIIMDTHTGVLYNCGRTVYAAGSLRGNNVLGGYRVACIEASGGKAHELN